MSGIYIPNMEMPTTCYDNCPCQSLHWCNVLKEITEPMTGKRIDNCPLISVPDHGRLIDADALQAECVPEPTFVAEMLFRKVNNASTIIPADKEDT